MARIFTPENDSRGNQREQWAGAWLSHLFPNFIFLSSKGNCIATSVLTSHHSVFWCCLLERELLQMDKDTNKMLSFLRRFQSNVLVWFVGCWTEEAVLGHNNSSRDNHRGLHILFHPWDSGEDEYWIFETIDLFVFHQGEEFSLFCFTFSGSCLADTCPVWWLFEICGRELLHKMQSNWLVSSQVRLCGRDVSQRLFQYVLSWISTVTNRSMNLISDEDSSSIATFVPWRKRMLQETVSKERIECT